LKNNQTIAFTLIETLAVVTAVGLLAAALLVPMIKQLDGIAATKETESLNLLAKAYKNYICSSKVVPSYTGWATNVANRLGVSVATVTNNFRGLRRVFLIDPALELGGVRATSLPYSWSLSNSVSFTTPPVSPRFMLISSISSQLPSGLVSGIGATNGANAFNNIWSTPEGQVPSGWSWSGNGEDLKVVRFDLTDLFVQIILNNRDSNTVANALPRFQMDDNFFVKVPVPFGGRKTYFIKGTELKLLNVLDVLEYSEVLTTSRSFTFEYGSWQGEAFVANAVSQTSPLDLQKIMNSFMNAPANTNAKFGASQLAVSNALVAFLGEYVTWRDAGYPGQFQGQGNPPKSLEDAQTALADVTNNLLTPP
jgi:type II secretory pathway pseudopilin PulG